MTNLYYDLMKWIILTFGKDYRESSVCSIESGKELFGRRVQTDIEWQ
jgi:hypothetical protein